MGRIFGLGFLVVTCGLVTLACDGESGAHGGRAKWLEECLSDADCGNSGSCLCGRCTVACTDSCDDGPEGTECTRAPACGTSESGVCVARCARTSDCAGGLVCKGGLCSAGRGDDADAGAPDAEGFPGEHVAGTDGAWARTLEGYDRAPPGWTARVFSAPPLIANGPDGDLIALFQVDVTLSKGDDDVYVLDDWLIRMDGETGFVEWVESVPTSARMAVDPAGNVFLAWPTLLQKLDPDGTLRWAKERAAELDYEVVNVAADSAGNVFVARVALTQNPSMIGGDPTGTLSLEKLDPDGNEIFSRTIGDGTGMLDSPFVTTDASNNVILLAGIVEGGADFGGGSLEGANVLAKYDPNGEHLFSKAVGGYPDIYSFINPVRTTPEGNIFLRSESIGPVDIGLGERNCTYYLFELDGAGAPLAHECLFIDDYTLMPEGGITTAHQVFDPIMVGTDRCLPNGIDADAGLLARYDAEFNLVGHYCNAQIGAIPEAVLAAPPRHLFISGAGFIMGSLPGTIVLPEGGIFVAKIRGP